jgi:4-hydroxybenzoate polyprenyltransferase
MLVVLLKYSPEVDANYWLKMVYLILPAVLTAAAGYIVNDIYDVNTDLINAPERVIIGKTMTKKQGFIVYFVLNVVSLLVSYKLSESYLIVNLCIITMLFLYAQQLKGMPLIGNLIVALCSAAVVASCTLICDFETGAGIMNIIGYIIFAFLISLIREIVKDMEDAEGDKQVGHKTYPILFGNKGAKIICYIFAGIETLFCGIYSVLAWGVDMYVPAIVMAIITIALFYFINLLSKAKEKKDFHFLSQFLKVMILIAVLNLIFT